MASNPGSTKNVITYPSAARKGPPTLNQSGQPPQFATAGQESNNSPKSQTGSTTPSSNSTMRLNSQSVGQPSTAGRMMNQAAASGLKRVGLDKQAGNPSTLINSQTPNQKTGEGNKVAPQSSRQSMNASGNGLKINNPAAAGAPVPAPRKLAPPNSSPGGPSGKRVVMRLRCKYRPLHDSYFKDGVILDQDTDVVFICGDGGRVKGHRIILASSMKFFSDVFSDQRPDEISTVSVPQIRSDVMKLIVMLSYKDNIVLTAQQMEILQDSVETFGIKLDAFKQELVEADVGLDVKPRKVMDSPPKLPPPLIARPNQQLAMGQHQRRMMQTNAQEGRSSQFMPNQQRPQTALRTGLHNENQQGVKKINRNVYEGEEDSDEGSEDSNFQFELQGYGNSSLNYARRMAKLGPRVETETDEMDEIDNNTDPEKAQNMIKEWMAKVGQDDRSTSPHKKTRMDPITGFYTAQQQANYECTVCNAPFIKQHSWKWHEERHVGLGLFKCKQCDQILKTARSLWTHEESVHNYVGISAQDMEEPRAIPSNFELVENKRHMMGLSGPNSRPMGKSQMQQPLLGIKNVNALRLAQMKRLKASNQQPVARAAAIGIGHSIGSEHLDSRKIKQLHWLYVCAKCDNCSDSSIKAMTHYSKCYPNEEVNFEATVTKFRQGFYGKSKCPMCPRRYAANGGFMIHCGHMHPEYRRLFSHTGAVEDKLKCINCHRKFALPDELHDHLENGIECNKSPINEDSMPLLSSSRISGGSGTPGDNKNKRRPISNPKYSPAQDDTTAAITASLTPVVQPRSARLAKRASISKALAQAEQEEIDQTNFNKRIGTTKRRASAIDYPPADCPICGATEVSNISQHLGSDHQDLNVSVNRISTDLLRCRKCLITFAICDLLAHTNSCSSVSGEDLSSRDSHRSTPDPNAMNESQDSSTSELLKPEKEEHILVDLNNLPPGIGQSPIDRIENTDLFSKDALKRALICGVCGNTAPKLGEIAACLKSHGIHRCVLCFNSYTNRVDYSAHLKKCHGSVGPGPTANKVKCPLCNRLFINAGQVAGHMYKDHWVSLLKEMRREFFESEDFAKDTQNSTVKSETKTRDEDEILREGSDILNDVEESTNTNEKEDEVNKTKSNDGDKESQEEQVTTEKVEDTNVKLDDESKTMELENVTSKETLDASLISDLGNDTDESKMETSEVNEDDTNETNDKDIETTDEKANKSIA